jgi:tRNA(Arg) A34 adenosine deaminase TadA
VKPGAISEVVLRVPAWIEQEIDLAQPRTSDDDKMLLAIELAQRNIMHGGGPFGAAIFQAESGEILSVGANWVVAQQCSLFHAEVTAIALGQARLAKHTLGIGNYELYASSEPCAQCLGATCWSGVRRLVCGAPASAAEAIGFDEGPRRDDWVKGLESRGIRVTLGLLADRATAVLQAYAAQGGAIYNP